LAEKREAIWIARELSKCSGCRKCEIACSLFHENRIWPEASRIRVFMLIPGVDFPHFCVQCEDYPCVNACPANALSISRETGAVLVDAEACTACGSCIEACPGKINMRFMRWRPSVCEGLSRGGVERFKGSFQRKLCLQALCAHSGGDNTGFGC
jgi:Fe-S-cluster-containing hydrogenase component 2